MKNATFSKTKTQPTNLPEMYLLDQTNAVGCERELFFETFHAEIV